MVSEDNECIEKVQDEPEQTGDSSTPKLTEYVAICIPSSETRQSDRRSRLLDFLKARPSREWLKLSSPFSAFQGKVNKHEELSVSVPTPAGIPRRFHTHFIRRINWASTLNMFKGWLFNPMNVALLLWLICVAVSATMLGLLLTGLLDRAFPSKALRNYWIEINNQVLNALFTLMSLYQHPNLFHHLILLCRWRSEDIIELRKIYCKNVTYRPREWAHMMVVVVLLHIACFAQYALCVLFWEYRSAERSELVETSLVVLGTAAPVIAGVYTVYSPLSREYELESGEEQSAENEMKQSGKVGLKLYDRRALVSRPEWAGGLFDCSEDITVGYLSFFCTCCVFGWNMERLGFGNMYVHMVLFLLLCIAPFFVLNITALNIHNEVISDIVAITGRAVSVFGLLYGGYWRIQMRRRFKLPGSKLCCGSESLTDYFQWMFCWSCSLAQEVRTGNLYDVEDDSLFRKNVRGDEEVDPFLQTERCKSPLPVSSEARFVPPDEIQGECSSSSSSDSSEGELHGMESSMAAPVQPSMQLEYEVSEEEAYDSLPGSPLIRKVTKHV